MTLQPILRSGSRHIKQDGPAGGSRLASPRHVFGTYPHISFVYVVPVWPSFKPRPNKSLAIQVLCPQPHPSTLTHSPSLTSYTTKVSKQPSTTRKNTRYDPYQSSDRPCRRPGLRPRRNRSETHHSQPSGNICQPPTSHVSPPGVVICPNSRRTCEPAEWTRSSHRYAACG